MVGMHIGIVEAHQLGNTLTARSKVKAQEGAAIVIQVPDVPPARLPSTKID
ncbi:hypothetical protein GCM10010975_14950 [Comamonas phosphati]|nr:hypothetical protein GCM10010975_14950 [Comamonas phosphati]